LALVTFRPWQRENGTELYRGRRLKTEHPFAYRPSREADFDRAASLSLHEVDAADYWLRSHRRDRLLGFCFGAGKFYLGPDEVGVLSALPSRDRIDLAARNGLDDVIVGASPALSAANPSHFVT
jgi:hypothetical protein